MRRTFSIGWDVGAWGRELGDALWIVDGAGNTHGKPCHGNWGNDIQQARTAREFIQKLFLRCGRDLPPDTSLVTLAIDAPLAFPASFVKLLKEEHLHAEPLGKAIENPYLFRRTEAFAARERGRNPLSPLQDPIGSQTTKISHVLAKFGFHNNGAGVWLAKGSDEFDIHLIEAYPAMCKESKDGPLLPGPLKLPHDRVRAEHTSVTQDENDALICALIAHLHLHEPDTLHSPLANPGYFLPEEGWIWFPKKEQ